MPRPMISTARPCAAVLALALTACATTAAPPATGDGAAYMALGTEPFWSLEITSGRLAWHNADGQRIAVANPGARPSFNGERYVSPRLTVDITHSACSDGMSERRYRDTVLVEADGQHLRGCGGAILPPDDLNGTNWRIISIDGQPVAGDRPAQFRFADGSISGSAGCNRITGSYRVEARRLTVGQLAMTRMACAGPAMMQENRVADLLRAPVTIRFPADGRMILTADGGGTIVLDRAD